MPIIGFSKSKMQQAIAVFEEYLKMQPDDFQIHNQLGAIYAQMGKIDLAIQHFSQALKINPEFEDAFQNLKTARSLKASRQTSG
jgi:Flp pilus assembly protein TadD